MKKTLLFLTLIVILGSNFFGNSILNVMAEEASNQNLHPYYKSIQIKEGDTLWNIALEYKEKSGMDTVQYVRELKNINNLKEDTIHAGHYLTIVYFSENPIANGQ
ncbi:MAG: LysM peptidoglycan-binding domain-containing protein [Clostridiaceae bacterium]|nr:LysM peptidoglycan-binding domain-containing protein [Clostridiaceae bacterium]